MSEPPASVPAVEVEDPHPGYDCGGTCVVHRDAYSQLVRNAAGVPAERQGCRECDSSFYHRKGCLFDVAVEPRHGDRSPVLDSDRRVSPVPTETGPQIEDRIQCFGCEPSAWIPRLQFAWTCPKCAVQNLVKAYEHADGIGNESKAECYNCLTVVILGAVRADDPAARVPPAAQSSEFLHWRFVANATDTACGREAKPLRTSLITDFVNCPDCLNAVAGYQHGRSQSAAITPAAQPGEVIMKLEEVAREFDKLVAECDEVISRHVPPTWPDYPAPGSPTRDVVEHNTARRMCYQYGAKIVRAFITAPAAQEDGKDHPSHRCIITRGIRICTRCHKASPDLSRPCGFLAAQGDVVDRLKEALTSQGEAIHFHECTVGSFYDCPNPTCRKTRELLAEVVDSSGDSNNKSSQATHSATGDVGA